MTDLYNSGIGELLCLVILIIYMLLKERKSPADGTAEHDRKNL